MKHERSVFQGRGFSTLAVAGVVFFGALTGGRAQITSGYRDDTQTSNRNSSGYSQNPAPGGAVPGSPMIRRGELQNAAIVNTGFIQGTSLVTTDMHDAELWARSIIHSDGSYTETKKNESDTGTVIQKTKSASGVLLQERIIQADAEGFPSEVMIKDARGNFKYRGVLVYDQYRRFAEELLYDMNNNLLRRRIQEYGPSGQPKLRVVDYVKNLPADIQLVITDETTAGNRAEVARRNYDRFAREAREVRQDGSGQPKKKGFFGKIFGRKKKD